MADTADSKSADLTVVRVRLPPRARERFEFVADAAHRPTIATQPRGGRVSTIGRMKRLVLLAALVGFVVWRGRRLEAHDREHGYGAYADVRPVTD